jgi:asparagine synthase (glutamine-hydrolysing)
MCGIVGYLGKASGSSPLSGALERLRPRGPDATGNWTSPDGQVSLGHTRLAIIDLSETGAQPMRDEATGNVIVFNGEIYNHPELRRELEQLGVAFRGHSDTETLLHGYGVWGTTLFPRLRGMFAFAIYNARSREVVLCRDRLGIKPLYMATTPQGATVFASEVRALLPWVGAQISNSGLAAYLQRGSCPHEQLLFEHIEEFPSGCWAALKLGQPVRPNRYWPSGVVADLDIDHNHSDAPREIRRLLEDAVSSHLLADVPVACFLSGGIDSSIITAMAARQMGSRKLSTFSVGFAEAAFDESKFARQMADLYGTDHHHITLSDADKLEHVSRAVEAMDLPSRDAINTYIVSDYVARSGFKVVLSGLGADEVFGGYPIFRDYSLVRTVAGTPRWLRSLIWATGKAHHLLDDLPQEKDGEMLSIWWRRIWTDRRLRDLGLPTPPFNREPAPPLRDTMAELSWGEISHYMRDTLLRDSDAMSMAHSLELRVPFLDTPLVTRVLAYPARVKFNPNRPKDLLLRATQDLIPEEIWNRPKMGFSLPMRTWMLGPLRDYCRDGLEVLSSQSLISPKNIDRAWSDFEGNTLHWPATWSLVVLGHYLRKNAKTIS